MPFTYVFKYKQFFMLLMDTYVVEIITTQPRTRTSSRVAILSGWGRRENWAGEGSKRAFNCICDLFFKNNLKLNTENVNM